MSTIHAVLSSDSIAAALDRQVTSPSPVLSLCRQLIGAGVASSLPMEVYREGSSVWALRIASIGEAALLEATPSGFLRRKSPKKRDKSSPTTTANSE